MIGVWAYLLLAALTGGFLAMTLLLFRRTGSWSLMLGLAMVFFWTLMGAWPFIGDALSGFQGYRLGLGYHYLMEKMFPFELNMDYVRALGAYGLFLVGLFTGLYLLAGRRSAGASTTPPMVLMDHRRILAMGLGFTLLALVLVLPQLRLALEEDITFYEAVRSHGGRWASVHALANLVGACCIIFGYAAHLGGSLPGALFTHGQAHWPRIAYPLALVLLGIYVSVIGDRHTVFTFFLLGVLLLVTRSGLAGLRRSGWLVALCVGALMLGGWVRGFSPKEIRTLERKERTVFGDYHFQLESIRHIPEKHKGLGRFLRPLWSNEMFAAHFSMYGVLHREVPVEPGISFRYLLASAVPAALGGERPPAAYDHYAEHAGLTPGQGYTIHHATAWYINGGWIGLLLGGLLLGAIWGAMLRWSTHRMRSPLFAFVPPMLPLLLVAFLPALLRSGPEAYKMLVMEAWLIPLLVITATIQLHGTAPGQAHAGDHGR
jgi:hypothetical protein